MQNTSFQVMLPLKSLNFVAHLNYSALYRPMASQSRNWTQPIKAVNHFFGQILLKLSRNVNNVINVIPLVCFILKMNTNEDICFKRF
jgi:hypothetical protein